MEITMYIGTRYPETCEKYGIALSDSFYTYVYDGRDRRVHYGDIIPQKITISGKTRKELAKKIERLEYVLDDEGIGYEWLFPHQAPDGKYSTVLNIECVGSLLPSDFDI